MAKSVEYLWCVPVVILSYYSHPCQILHVLFPLTTGMGTTPKVTLESKCRKYKGLQQSGMDIGKWRMDVLTACAYVLYCYLINAFCVCMFWTITCLFVTPSSTPTSPKNKLFVLNTSLVLWLGMAAHSYIVLVLKEWTLLFNFRCWFRL